jgi:serine/threonine-protein kinase RsbW
MSSVARQDPVGAGVHPRGEAGAARLRLALTLPRATSTLPMVRAVLDSALVLMGVTADCRGELAVALSEACTNAIVHARAGDGYEVLVTLHGSRCVIEVADTGVGVDSLTLEGAMPEPLAPRGRGLHLIRGFTNAVELRPVRPNGLAVRMSRNVTYDG